MGNRGRIGGRIRASIPYRFLYIVVVSFGGVGVAMFFFGTYLGWGWAPSSVEANAWLALAILAVAAYLGFVLGLSPIRSTDVQG